MRYCVKSDSSKGDASLCAECPPNMNSSFEVAHYSENYDSMDERDVRDSGNRINQLCSCSNYPLGDNLSPIRKHLPGSTSGVFDSELSPNRTHDNECLLTQKGSESGCRNRLNSVKGEVTDQKGIGEFCAKCSGKAMPTRGLMKAQSHYNSIGNTRETRKLYEKTDILREQIDKYDGSSLGYRECCDEDGTSHVDEEETLESSEISVNRHTPLRLVQNNENMRMWVKPDFEKSHSFCLNRAHFRVEDNNEGSLFSQKKPKITPGSYCVILPRTYGVNMKLLRTTTTRQSSCGGVGSLLRSVKKVVKGSDIFPLQQLQLTLFDEAKEALEESLFQDVKLELHGNSAGGTYMVHRLSLSRANDCKVFRDDVEHPTLSVFKPRDEEIGQKDNPHGNCRSDRVGFIPGSGSRREVLAYCLDHDHFAGIPPTLEVSAVHSLDGSFENAMCSNSLMTTTPNVRVGSLQLFIPGCIDAADVLPGRFLIEEVHALAIFDIRTLNSDRHGGNVLVRYEAHGNGKSGVPHLVPIDHSYICPAGYEDPDYEWLSWPQSKVPFFEKSLTYIRNLDAATDADLVAAALAGSCVRQTNASAPKQPTSPESFENDSSTATVQEILDLKDKQWVVEDLWLMSSPLCENQFTPPTSTASCTKSPKSLRHKEVVYDQHLAEDVRAAANTLYCATRLLQVAALEFGFTAWDIGNMCRRPRLTCPSLLEELIESSLDEATWETDRNLFELQLMERLEAEAVSREENSTIIPSPVVSGLQNL